MTDRLEEIEKRAANAVKPPFNAPQLLAMVSLVGNDIPYLLARLRAAEAVIEAVYSISTPRVRNVTQQAVIAWEAAKAETVKP